MKFTSFILTAVLILFLQSCGQENELFPFKEKHIEHHQEHLDFIDFQKPFIESSFDIILEFLKKNSEQKYVMGQWHTTRDFTLELHYKTRAYVSSCINTTQTSLHISGMGDQNLYLSTEFSLNTVDFEVAVAHGQYELAASIIQSLKEKILGHVDGLREEAALYLEAVSSENLFIED